MTPEAAVYNFLSSFGIPAYAATSVPHDAQYPYITYQLVIGEMFEPEVSMPVNVWYRTDSEAQPNAKVREMYDRIGFSGVTIPCDGGMIWIKRGVPWSQSIGGEGEDDKLKRRYINMDVDFFTA